MIEKKFSTLFLVGLFVFLNFCAFSAFAQGGPPMITDDPNTVGDGKWEINIAMLNFSSSAQWVGQVPYFDINYGVGDSLQLKYESGISSVADSPIPVGGAFSMAGVRFKFYEDEKSGVALSTYPQYAFFPAYYVQTKGVNSAQTSFFLPLEASKKNGDYTWVNELGYNFVTGADSFWSEGVLLSREMTKSWELIAEVHANIPVSLNLSQFVFNLGTTFELSEKMTLLASAGSSFATSNPFWISYLGLQLHF